ncbi:hypothetical protein [Nonomuraea sp. NPDC049400]|uniref:hypothetical protein n=1 Tax=Nonomuraea sp. NPDC049400 TaxID=3364352 RepID=UPI00378B2DE2
MHTLPWPAPGAATALRLSADRMTIATDGTDDALVTVELLDASGSPAEHQASPVTDYSTEDGWGSAADTPRAR